MSDHREATFRAGDGDILALLYEKVVTGNGDDSLIRKNDRLEGRVSALETNLASNRQDLKDVKKMFWAIVVLLLTILGTVIGTDIASQHTAQGQVPPSHSDLYAPYN